MAVGLWFRPAAVGMAVRHDTVCLLRMRLKLPVGDVMELQEPVIIAPWGDDG